MIKALLLAVSATIALAPLAAVAQQKSAVGLWKTIDDHSGKPKSLIRISEADGEYRGKIEKLFREPNEDQNPKCDKCEDARKDQPIIGMTILTGMKQEQKDSGEYSGGQILDPAEGKVYKSKMALADGGKKLNVRGYIGVPLLGRTQTWLRAD
ncbi:MAG TPA: DUF2147 domain-containing protein [Burkholderiaceae bacterium]|nr:DUF2147 domain-containing protein [Burkholderiaceae bacterium]